jgi:phage baseplate assembly protein W
MAQFNSKSKSSRVSRRWFTDIDVNMTLHPQTGDLVLKYDINAIKRSIRNLLTTNLFERPFKPSLGINLSAMLFELGTAETDTIVLERDIISLINNYERRANVQSITSIVRGHNLDITMFITISNDPRPQEINITLQRVR